MTNQKKDTVPWPIVHLLSVLQQLSALSLFSAVHARLPPDDGKDEEGWLDEEGTLLGEEESDGWNEGRKEGILFGDNWEGRGREKEILSSYSNPPPWVMTTSSIVIL